VNMDVCVCEILRGTSVGAAGFHLLCESASKPSYGLK
jgi:hypothetical protein